jgi:hypothetical protein
MPVKKGMAGKKAIVSCVNDFRVIIQTLIWLKIVHPSSHTCPYFFNLNFSLRKSNK